MHAHRPDSWPARSTERTIAVEQQLDPCLRRPTLLDSHSTLVSVSLIPKGLSDPTIPVEQPE